MDASDLPQAALCFLRSLVKKDLLHMAMMIVTIFGLKKRSAGLGNSRPEMSHATFGRLSAQTRGKIKVAFMVVIVTVAVGVFMYYFTFTSVGYGNWRFVIMNIVLFSLFFLLSSFRKKLNRLPNSVYVAFIVALFTEMYGIPLTMYFFMGFFGYSKIFSLEFLLTRVVGTMPFYIVYHYYIFPASKFIIGFGMLLVIFGWHQIFQAKGKLVKTGLYKYIRNPQYLGFLMITGGLNIQWLTIITTALWPVLAFLYYRLAKIEEKEAEAKYGEEFRTYKRAVPMFIPRLKKQQELGKS